MRWRASESVQEKMRWEFLITEQDSVAGQHVYQDLRNSPPADKIEVHWNSSHQWTGDMAKLCRFMTEHLSPLTVNEFPQWWKSPDKYEMVRTENTSMEMHIKRWQLANSTKFGQPVRKLTVRPETKENQLPWALELTAGINSDSTQFKEMVADVARTALTGSKAGVYLHNWSAEQRFLWTRCCALAFFLSPYSFKARIWNEK